jgi:Domain of unknown function (DUF4349)
MPELLEDDIRASAPQPREAFVQRLEQRVEAGFPKQRKPRRHIALWKPATALAFSVLFAVVVLASVVNPPGTDDSDNSGSGGSSAIEQGEPASEGGAAPQAAPAPSSSDQALRLDPPERGVASPGRPRVVQRSAQLGLSAPADEFDEVAAGVLDVAQANSAIVQRSNVTERDGRGYATYDLRVPISRLDTTLAQLGDLGKVTTRRESSDDITGAYVSAQDRLRDARAERRALLRALERSDSARQRSDIRRRLTVARQDIARAERDVRRTRARADRGRVEVTVRSSGESGAWTPGDALDDAGRILEVVVGVLLVVAAVLAPLLALALAATMAARLLRRRRRNAVLG